MPVQRHAQRTFIYRHFSAHFQHMHAHNPILFLVVGEKYAMMYDDDYVPK